MAHGTTSERDMNWLEHLKIFLFPPVSRDAALEIARQTLMRATGTASLVCHGRKPGNFLIYGNIPEPCWWIVAPMGDGKDCLVISSSRVIAVGRQTGKVHYDGSAGDEG